MSEIEPLTSSAASGRCARRPWDDESRQHQQHPDDHSVATMWEENLGEADQFLSALTIAENILVLSGGRGIGHVHAWKGTQDQSETPALGS